MINDFDYSLYNRQLLVLIVSRRNRRRLFNAGGVECYRVQSLVRTLYSSVPEANQHVLIIVL